jgi:hypothetical protein
MTGWLADPPAGRWVLPTARIGVRLSTMVSEDVYNRLLSLNQSNILYQMEE